MRYSLNFMPDRLKHEVSIRVEIDTTDSELAMHEADSIFQEFAYWYEKREMMKVNNAESLEEYKIGKSVLDLFRDIKNKI